MRWPTKGDWAFLAAVAIMAALMWLQVQGL